MMKLKALFCITISIIISINIHPAYTEEGYGPFEVRQLQVKVCEKTMKPQPYSQVAIETVKGKEGQLMLLVNITVTNDVGPLMGKLKIFKVTDGKSVQTLAINQANVCQYAFPLKLLPFTLKVDKKCIVKPAVYTNEVIDVQSMAYGFIGKKFFYGTFRFTLEWFSKKHTGLCFECLIESGPKKS